MPRESCHTRKGVHVSPTHRFSIGVIGAGHIAQAIAARAVVAGHHVKLSNSRGPESLAELVDRLGPNASAGTVAEAAQAEIVILAVLWDEVPEAVQDLPDWDRRIVIDATNQWNGPGTAVDLGEQTGSERNAALMPGARVVKAFDTLEAAVVAQNPGPTSCPVVVFLAGDDADAKATISAFADSMGFAPVDLGGLRAGRLMQVGGGPLSGLHLVKVE
jgi:predicted dinucleotide-binding enzyme